MRVAAGAAVALTLAGCSSTARRAPPAPPRPYTFELAPAPPEPPGSATSRRGLKLKPRPPLALSSILPPRDPPWPLTELPSLQPHLDLAMAHDACTEDWAKRHASDAEASSYVAAWCKIRGGDRDAVSTLGQLARTARHEVARAALLDVVNLLADQELAKDAIARLDAMGLTTPETLDLLAGTYVGLGMHDDAAVVGERVLRASDYASPQVRCERWLAWGAFDLPTKTELERVDDRAGDCSKRAHAALCAIDATSYDAMSCFHEAQQDAEMRGRIVLVTTWMTWRDDPVDLLDEARTFEKLMQLPGAEELAVTASEDAILSSSCKNAIVGAVHDVASALLRDPHHAPRFDDRLHALSSLTLETCPAFKGGS